MPVRGRGVAPARGRASNGVRKHGDVVFMGQHGGTVTTGDEKWLVTILKQGRKTGILNLGGKGFTTVPEKVWDVNEINVTNNGTGAAAVIDFSCTYDDEDKWWEANEVQKLILASNKLVEISPKITNLSHLTAFDCHDNCLTSIDPCIGELVNLKTLDLSRNQISKISENSLTQLTNLEVLNLSDNLLTILPNNIDQLYGSLRSLNLSNNKLERLPETFGFLRNVLTLSLQNNNLVELPLSIGELDHLQMFDLSFNQLKDLPEELKHLKHLKQLYLNNNKLTKVPDLTYCYSLKELKLGYNSIYALPPDFLRCVSKLSILDARDNKISVLSPEIVQLQELERLDMTNNDLSSVPTCLGRMSALKVLSLEGNALKSLRREVLLRGTVAVKRYLTTIDGGADGDAEVALPTAGTSSLQRSGPTGDGSELAIDVFEAKRSRVIDVGRHVTFTSNGNTVDTFAKKSKKDIFLECKEAENLVCQALVSAAPTNLKMVGLNLDTVPPGVLLAAAKSVEDLQLQRNRLVTLPSEIGAFSAHLVCLDVSSNRLTSLPSEFAMLRQLRIVNLSLNRLASIPATAMSGMARLECLNVSDNAITVLDDDVVDNFLLRASGLTTFDISNNQLAQVTPRLGLCRSIRALNLDGNGLRVPRLDVLRKGTDYVMQYLRDKIPQD